MIYTIDNIDNSKEVNYKLELTKDSIFSIALLVTNLLYLQKFNIVDLPRSETTLRFIEVLEDLGVKFSWNGYTELQVKYTKLFSEDLSHITNTNALNLFIPLLLSKNGTVSISDKNVELAKKYHEYGFVVYEVDDKFQINHPEIGNEISIALNATNIYESFSLLMLKKIYNLDIDVENFNDTRVIAIENIHKMFKDATAYPKTYSCLENLTELELFSTLALLRKGKLGLFNHQMSESVEFLLYLNNICSTYEVIDDAIRLWYQEKTKINNHFDFSNLSSFSAFFLIVLNLKYNKPFTVKVVFNEYTKRMLKMIRNYKIKIQDIKVVNGNLVIKFDTQLPKINTHTQIDTFEDGVYSLVLSNLIEGSHKINNLEKTLSSFIGLQDKLVEMGINIKNA